MTQSFHFKWLTTLMMCSAVASAASVDTLLKDLKSPTPEVRQKALDGLGEIADEGFTEKESLQVLNAAGLTYPQNGDLSINAELLSLLSTDPSEKLIQPLVQIFPKLDSDAKWYALDVLGSFENSPTALKTYLGLVGKHAAALDGLPVENLSNQKDAAVVMFPELFKYTRYPKLQYDIYRLALDDLYSEDLTTEQLRKSEKTILNDYQALASTLKAAQQDRGTDWHWQKPYSEQRYLGGIMLDLMGFLKTSAADAALQNALSFKDPHLQAWAAISLVYNQKEVPAEVLENIAASNEMRLTLFDYLQDAERPELFPRAYRTQPLLGASQLTEVLLDEDQLGYEPASIEFIEKFTVQDGDDLNDYYVYKFTDQDQVAYAGIAGPYSPAKVVTSDGGRDTTTLFKKWDELTPRGHLDAILGELALDTRQ